MCLEKKDTAESVKAWSYGKVNSHHEIKSLSRAFCANSASVHIQNAGK